MEGDVAGASTEFTVVVNCDNDAYDTTLTLNEGNNWRDGNDNIPAGVKCQVTEPTVPAGWDLASVQIVPSGQFTISDSAAVAIEVTNVRQTGDVEVKKVIVGDVAGASTEFTVLAGL